MKHFTSSTSLGLLLLLGCSSSTSDEQGAAGSPAIGSGGMSTTGGTAGTTGASGSTAAGGTGGASQSGVGGSSGAVASAGGAGGAATGGSDQGGAEQGGTGGSTSDGGAGQQPPMLNIDPNRMNREDIEFNVTDADPTASGFHGGGQLASFDGSKTVQGYLVITMGGIGGGPHTGGAYQWAVGRGFHALAVDMFNANGGEGNGGKVYLETFSGQDLTGAANVTPQNGVMNRVKTGLAYLDMTDPGADWGYYLDTNGDVIWSRVIVWGYSYGGQAAVAASKFVAAHRIIATSAPRIPTNDAESSWITDMPNVADPANCYAINDDETDFWNVLTTMGWLGPPLRIFDGGALLAQPPFQNTHMLDMAGGHTEFCSLPNAAYDAACDYAFGTVP